MRRSHKQKLALQLLNDPQVVDLLFGGGAGGGKSIEVGMWMLIQCRNYPGIRIGLGRKEITRLKQTTVVTLLGEVHPMFGVTSDEFIYNEQKSLITYINGSEIQLVDLARQPSDPNCDRFGSLNLTHVVIEEVGEVTKKERDIFISRKNRWLNGKYGIVGKSVSTCNPSQNYIKLEYYNKYKELGRGDYQKWPHGNVEINGEMKEAYRAFVQSLAKDNPFLPRNYIEVLNNLPDAERRRLRDGEWDFEDSDWMLFKSTTIDRSITRELKAGKRSIGVDIADTGSDRTIISLVEEGILVEQKEVEVDKSGAIGEQIAMEIIRFAQLHGMDIHNAQDIGIDGIGVGASTRDFLRSKGWGVKEFIAGAASNGNYSNLRTEILYRMSVAMMDGTFKIYEGLETLNKLRDQLLPHRYFTEEKKIVVESKNKVKEYLGGMSPDHVESAYIAYWVANGIADPRNNPNRIIY